MYVVNTYTDYNVHVSRKYYTVLSIHNIFQTTYSIRGSAIMLSLNVMSSLKSPTPPMLNCRTVGILESGDDVIDGVHDFSRARGSAGGTVH